jgi:transposase
MLALSSSCRYFLYHKGTDMRCGIYSLAGLVRNELKQDPLNGDVFIFLGKRSNQIRLLQWDKYGFALYSKRLELGTFQWPNWNCNSLLEGFFRQQFFLVQDKAGIAGDFGFLVHHAFFFGCTSLRYIQK